MFIADGIQYVGVNDHQIDLFEGQYVVPNGMAYNSYVILDDQIAVMDAVDIYFADEWLANVEAVTGGRAPDYLIIQHMEPDHSGSVMRFLTRWPEAKAVASLQAFNILKNFFGTDLAERRVVVADNAELSLGKRTLTFKTAPMVHWPEVIFTWDAVDGVLFSADAFGKFGALDVEDPEGWACEARRYYFGIVGKFGPQVQAALKKLAGLEIRTICPLHGPVLSEDLGTYLNLYQTWSTYGTESEGIVINYTSVYGHTTEAVNLLKEELLSRGCPKVAVNDLARCDVPEAVEDTFRYGTCVLATTTYAGDIFPFMRSFIDHLTERNWQNKTVAFMENGSWAPIAAKIMAGMLEKSKNLTFAQNTVTIRSAVNETAESAIKALATELWP